MQESPLSKQCIDFPSTDLTQLFIFLHSVYSNFVGIYMHKPWFLGIAMVHIVHERLSKDIGEIWSDPRHEAGPWDGWKGGEEEEEEGGGRERE